MQQSKEQDIKTCGCLSDKGCIVLLCIIKLIICPVLHTFWYAMIMGHGMDKNTRMTAAEFNLMVIMLLLSVGTMISAIVGLIAVCRKYVAACRVFMIWHLLDCVHFGVTTIGLIALTVFVVSKGGNKMDDYRWTKGIQDHLGDLSIIPPCILASTFFILVTFWSIIWNGNIRRFTKHVKSLVVPPSNCPIYVEYN